MFIGYAGLLVIGAGLLLLDLVLLAILVVGVVGALWIAVSRSEKAFGQVIGIDERRRTARSVPVRVAYDTPTGRFEIDGAFRSPYLGEQVPVRYRSSHPEQATTVRSARFWRMAMVAVPALAVTAALAVGMIIGADWYFGHSHPQLQAPLGGGSFALALALLSGAAAVDRYQALVRWRRMAQADGKILRHADEPEPDEQDCVLISFPTQAGEENEFWTEPDAPAAVGDIVTVYYNPKKPAATATLKTEKHSGVPALYCAAFALIFGVLGILAFSML